MAHIADIQRQFDLRAGTFERSVHWVTDEGLGQAHVKAAGTKKGKGLEMCCGTGFVARALQDAGWDMIGVDISEQMVREAQKHVPAMQGDVENLDFPDGHFDLIVLRQAYFLLANGPKVLAEVKRLLKSNGSLVISLIVPFSDVDAAWLKKVHTVKQAQMIRYFTAEDLGNELRTHGFSIQETLFSPTRESVSLWMQYAPELSDEIKRTVCDLVSHAPDEYKKLRNVEVVDGEILEDWNWVIYAAEVV